MLNWVKENEGKQRIVELEVFKEGNWVPITEEQKDREEAAKTAARDKACAVIPETKAVKSTLFRRLRQREIGASRINKIPAIPFAPVENSTVKARV